MLNATLTRNPIVRRASVVAAVLLSTVAAHPAAQQTEPRFDVASIKENKSDTDRVYMNVLPGGRLVATNISLEGLITGAYGGDIPLPTSRVLLPAGWAANGPYTTAPPLDIDAKAGRVVKQGELLAAVRHLLEERFKVAVPHERREHPSYAMVMDRADGRMCPRLKRSDINCTDPAEAAAKQSDGTLRCGIRGRQEARSDGTRWPCW